MRTTQRRPSALFLAGGVLLWSLALALEVAALLRGEPLVVLGLELRIFVIGAALALVGLAAIDLFALRRRRPPVVRRVLPRSLALKSWSPIGIEVRAIDALGARAELIDETPQPAELEGLPIRLAGAAGEVERAHYRFRSLQRGDVRFGQPTLRAHSPLGLWRYTARVGLAETERVFPNFAATARFDALLSEARVREVGIKRRQRRGEGLEFHQLREYRSGDSIRQIDWKATSRKRELVSREYEEERDQRVVFLLDCSRRMRTKDGDLSHFDHSLNAMILLSHVALKGGDAVGLLSFGEERRWLPPAKGASSVHRLLQTVYDLEPTTLGVDFRGAAEELCRRQRRRSMIVVMTHLRPEDLQDLLPAVDLLRRTHYVVLVDLRQAELDELLGQDPADLSGAFSAMGAWRYEIERRALHDRLRGHGLPPIDTTPDQLGAAIVSRYYEVKQGGQL